MSRYYFAGFQTRIGYNDVKSSPVYFYVKRGTDYDNYDGFPIPFEWEIINIGNAMNRTSGMFIAPKTGTYFFSFNGRVSIPSSSYYSFLSVSIYCPQWGRCGSGAGGDVATAEQQYDSLSAQATLSLRAGDEVYVRIDGMSTGTYLTGDFTTFSGWLLEENVAESLNIK